MRVSKTNTFWAFICLEDPLSGSKTIELRMYFPHEFSDFGFSHSLGQADSSIVYIHYSVRAGVLKVLVPHLGDAFAGQLAAASIPFRVAIACAITTWLIAQIAGLAADNINAPECVMKMIITMLVLGAPVSLMMSGSSTESSLHHSTDATVRGDLSNMRMESDIQFMQISGNMALMLSIL